jgi:hypothetical protein
VIPVIAAPPLLLRVTVIAALLAPTAVLGNDKDVGETVTYAVAWDWNSTAPTSIAVWLTSGLGLPKKSLFGAIAYVDDVVGT